MSPDTQHETAPPIAESAPRRAREYSEWDPRSAPGTYALLAINILVFLWMLASGVSITNPSPQQLEHFGANNAILVIVYGQWYRLLTAMFVHIGIIHIATNMWCLWNLGLLGEPLLGPWGLIAVYILTGVAGNLLSITVSVIHDIVFRGSDWIAIMGAGASGAVFGIAGILIVLLSNHRLPIPWYELKRLRTSVVRFAAINLIIGLGTALPIPGIGVKIDNSAHIGGFLSGLALGPGLISAMTLGRVRYLNRQKIVFASAAFILSLYGFWVAHFK